RFGMGLKAATFSQARSLTVASKIEGGEIAVARWDLDLVEESGAWNLQVDIDDDPLALSLEQEMRGTIVVWRKVDLLFGTGGKDVDHFLQIAEMVTVHLGMIFHRFIESRRIEITLNGSIVKAWDPFASGDPNSRRLPSLLIDSGSTANSVILAGCILPAS